MTDKNIKDTKNIDNKPDRKRRHGYTKTVSSIKMAEYENIVDKVHAHLEAGLNITSACDNAKVTRTRYYNAVKKLQNEKKEDKIKRLNFFSTRPPIPIPTHTTTPDKKDIIDTNEVAKRSNKKEIVNTNKIVKKSEKKDESSEEVQDKKLVTNKKKVKPSNIKGGHDKSSSESSEESSTESSENDKRLKKKGSNNISNEKNKKSTNNINDKDKDREQINGTVKRLLDKPKAK
jgi:hypothetical protein